MKMPLRITAILIITLLVAGIVFSQSSTDTPFTFVQQIGEVAPQGIQYDANFDRFVMVDIGGQLVLADAKTREIQHIIYESGDYYGYRFSHDGKWLAVAEGNTVDIWNTNTGELDLELQPTVALGFDARLEFSDDDTLLLFKAFVPAPDEIRRSEDDTTLTPWLWDLEAERRNRTAILPEQRRAQPFFDLRTDLLLAPNNKLIAALPRSISVTDFSSGSYDVTANFETDRYEFDPIDIWYSMLGDNAYFRSKDGGSYYQINTETGTVYRLPLGSEFGRGQFQQLENLNFTQLTQSIGEGNTLQTNSFLRLLLTDNYHPNEAPLTVTLIDILDPVTVDDNQTAFLVYIYNERSARGVIDLIRPESIRDLTLNPSGTQVAVRRAAVGTPIEIYDIQSGNLISTFETRYPEIQQNTLFEYNATGDELLIGWERYNVYSGEAVVETPHFHPGFDNYVFSADDESIITINGRVMMQWDINTGEPIRREIVRLNGDLIARSPDARRYLTRIPFPNEGQPTDSAVTEEVPEEEQSEELFPAEGEDPDAFALLQAAEIPAIEVPVGLGVEIYDVTTGERRQVYFEQLPHSDIQQIIASPDWEHLLVVYAANQFSPYYPGNEIAIYSFDEGLVWYYAGDDLPAPRSRRYGWSDDNTAFVLSTTGYGADQPERIYGLDYHESGLPQCLVDAFPDSWMQWSDLWERLNARLRSDSLGRLTQELCDSGLENEEAVEAVFSPTPTPTHPPVQPTSSRIAGLPACLSNYFGRDAALYAPQWRALTEGLNDEQSAEVEEILCAGLYEGIDIPVPNVGHASDPRLQVVSIDVRTGQRTISAFAPLPVEEPRPLEPLLAEFRAQYGFEPLEARLSNNLELLAVRTSNNHVRVYRLNRPYQTYIDSLQATRDAAEADQPVAVSLLATPTVPGIELGGARPTLTPTFTPTPPPPPEATVDYAELGNDILLCEHEQIYSILEPPAAYNPTGQLLTGHYNNSAITVWNPANGDTTLGEGLRDPQAGGQLSPEDDWILIYDTQIVVSRADGSDPVVLYEDFEQSVFPQDIYWLDDQTLQIVYSGYLPDVSQNTVTLYRQYDVETGEYSDPVTATPFQRINQLETYLESIQPQIRRMVVLSIPFNAGYTQGWRYYLYDTVTGELDYFARVSEGTPLTMRWSPSGDAMYYQFPGTSLWYVYRAEDNQHWILGDLPSGDWSRDGRYRLAWYVPSANDLTAAPTATITPTLTTGAVLTPQPEPLVPTLHIWDNQTGLTRHYCIPGSGRNVVVVDTLLWSPDSRYLAFNVSLPDDRVDDIPRLRTVILDLETGSVTQLSLNIGRLILWME